MNWDAVFAWYWPIWLIIGFGIPEAFALARKDEGDTLSEHVRKWFATDKSSSPRKFVTLRRVALLGAIAWLSVHWLTDGTFV